MSLKLRDLIRNVRASKTAAQERAVIAKESALIRTSFKDQDCHYRHRNVAKLLFIHMLGYPSHFGQMECLKLIASPHFPDKKIGYLGLMLLLKDQEDVLTLVTNSIKNDLNHSNPFVAGLALTAVGNIASADMARDLAVDVDNLLKSDNEYLRKKAALAAIRVFKKVPDLVEDFVDRITALMKTRNHGVLITAVQLIIEIIKIDEENVNFFKKLVPTCVRLLRNLLSIGYVPEYDVAGIADPFLQVKLLQLLRLLGKDNEDASETMNDVLAQVATNTETAKNAGNSILYECVQTIMAIQSESGLRVLAINILGRFLLNRDNNIRYVALNTLSKVVHDDIASVQRHRNTIVECLKDPDASIRQRALELIYSLVNEGNIRTLARELLNYLVVAPDDKKSALCSRIADAVDRFTPNCRWHIDTLITMLSIAGSKVADDVVSSSLIALIQQNPDLHAYVVHKLFWALKEDISQQALVHVGVWCMGEYGSELMLDPPSGEDTLDGKLAVEEGDIVDLLKQILRSEIADDTTKGYVLNAMLKLTSRFRSDDQRAQLTQVIGSFNKSMDLELQQRACEYARLMGSEWNDVRREVLMKMPEIDKSIVRARSPKFGDDEDDEAMESASSAPEPKSEKKESAPAPNLLDLDDIFGGSSTSVTSTTTADLLGGSTASQAAPTSASNTVDLLSDIFSTGTPAPPAPMPTSSSNTVPGLLDFGAPAPPSYPQLTAYEKNGLVIALKCSKPNEAQDPSTSHILATFSNSTASPITDLLFQAAFPKYIKLIMDPPTSTTVPPNSSESVTQLIKIKNSMHGQKAVMMRIKLQFSTSQGKVEDMATVDSFSSNF